MKRNIGKRFCMNCLWWLVPVYLAASSVVIYYS